MAEPRIGVDLYIGKDQGVFQIRYADPLYLAEVSKRTSVRISDSARSHLTSSIRVPISAGIEALAQVVADTLPKEVSVSSVRPLTETGYFPLNFEQSLSIIGALKNQLKDRMLVH